MIRVIVAHETTAIREAALKVVRAAGHEGVGVADGESALALLTSTPTPAALIVDVGLPGRLGYELVEEIRRRALATRVILIASVYSRTAYKRRPTSLYGADDYVEQHHIPDFLPEKLGRILGGPSVPGPSVHGELSLAAREEVARIRDAGEGRLAGRLASVGGSGLERAREIARLIIADIVLYNGETVARGLAAGDLAARLAGDLTAGRELLLRHVPEAAGGPDLIADALADFVAHSPKGTP